MTPDPDEITDSTLELYEKEHDLYIQCNKWEWGEIVWGLLVLFAMVVGCIVAIYYNWHLGWVACLSAVSMVVISVGFTGMVLLFIYLILKSKV
jgi:hypothetical protein